MCQSFAFSSKGSMDTRLVEAPTLEYRKHTTDSVLFLQGPAGPFFSRIAADFWQRGFTVHKINLNGGDKVFYREGLSVDYTGSRAEWVEFLRLYLESHKIARIYVFGDCRFYHAQAKIVAEALAIDFFVFEEGYLRPNYITLEKGGVNGYSRLMDKSAFIGSGPKNEYKIEPIGRFTFILPAIYSITYYLAASIYSRKFSGYEHHRPLSWLSEGARWIRSGYRKILNRSTGEKVMRELDNRWQNQYFLCPLQVHCDMQVLVHSAFASIDDFIEEVLTSFAENAPERHALVFKHHPMDRGYKDYTKLINTISSQLAISERVYYVYDVCLPTLLRHASGSVMINSTVGLSSLIHGTPVKVLGNAVYDRVGLTFQGPLNSFWRSPGTVDIGSVRSFRSFLKRNNQLGGNFYKRCDRGNASGVIWPGKLTAEHTPLDMSNITKNEFIKPFHAASNHGYTAGSQNSKTDEIGDYPKSA